MTHLDANTFGILERMQESAGLKAPDRAAFMIVEASPGASTPAPEVTPAVPSPEAAAPPAPVPFEDLSIETQALIRAAQPGSPSSREISVIAALSRMQNHAGVQPPKEQA